MTIYVSNLSLEVQDEDLRELFVSYGEVKTVEIIRGKSTGKSLGFGYVQMVNDSAGGEAIAELNGFMFADRPIKVSKAKSMSEGATGGQEERNYNNPRSYNETIY